MTQRPVPKKVFRFDVRGRILGASTEDARLTLPVRILAVLLGLLLAAVGFGLLGLVAADLSFRKEGWDAGGRVLAFLPLLWIAGYGLDLLGRGILGRPWSRKIWQALDAWFSRRGKFWVPVLVGVVCVVLPAVNFFREGPDRFETLLFLPVVLLQVLGHELGHLMAARAVGYRPRRLAAGPLVFHVEGGRTRITRRRSWWLFVGGYAAYEPIGRTRAMDFLVIAAGPLANLLLAEGAFEIWGWPTAATVFSVFVRSWIGWGIGLALFNLIPLPRTTGGVALDGRELLDLRRR